MWTKTFLQINKSDASIAGGKGASLGELTQAGIPVPPGYIIISSAFDKFLEVSDVNVEIDAILRTVDINAIHTVEDAAVHIQRLILEEKEIPKDIEQEILDEFKKLGTEFVAVRSSATAEDSASAAWAGQLDTFLNTTEETLLQNIRKCWASLFTSRAIFYRFEKELNNEHISVAVVVQKMVNSEAAGIAFSVHPVTEDRNQIIIEAGFGLGEAVVSGDVTPDSYVVTKSPLKILDKNIQEQTKALFRGEHGGTAWRPIQYGGAQVLSDEKILALSGTIIAIENHYSFPCDIEWAKEGNNIFITQSRPITTLSGKRKIQIANVETVTAVREWHEFHKRSRSPFFSGVFLGGTGVKKDDFPFDHRVKHFGIFCDHVAIDMTEKDRLGEMAVKYLKKEPDFLLRLMGRAYREHEAAVRRWQKNDERNYSSFTNAELAEAFKEYTDDLFSFGIYVTLPLFAEGYFETYIQERFEERFNDDSQKWFGIAVNPIKDGTVLEEERSLLALASQTEPDIASHAERFCWMANPGFFEEYYDRTYYEQRLNESKTQNPKERLKEIEKERAEHNESFNKLLEMVSDDLYLHTVVKSANEAVFFRSYRTEMFYGSAFYNQNLFKEISKRLGLENYKDWVWLFWNETYDALRDGKIADKEIITSRKRAYVFLSDYDRDYVHWKDEEAKRVHELYEATKDIHQSSDVIKGSGAFAGKIQGRAVVVHSIKELDKVQRGDILVTHATNVNFVPALKKVIAIVTEEGGILSHASIISRELRIPCVIGTKIATKVLKDGDEIEVDADMGTVRVLK